jgi:hypothetical protein
LFDAEDDYPCEGLSLIQEDFSTVIDGSKWEEAEVAGGEVRRRSNGVDFSTGPAGDEARFAVMGTKDPFEMAGTLSLRIESLDLRSDSEASFFVHLESLIEGEEEALGLAIQGANLLLFSALGNLATQPPPVPFWLVLDIKGPKATLSYFEDESGLTSVGSVDFAPEPVTLLLGVGASAMSDVSAHTAQVTQIGDAPGRACE